MAVDYIAASAGEPGVKRFGCFGGWVFEIVDLERETQAAVS
jgi:hypothetical protein